MIASTAQAVAAAQAVHEARVAAMAQATVDDALFELEHRYWKLADELDRKRKPGV